MSWEKFDAERAKKGNHPMAAGMNQENKGASDRHAQQAARIQTHRQIGAAPKAPQGSAKDNIISRPRAKFYGK
jgi:hypothetical protein